MLWIRSHRYTVALMGVAALVVAGALLERSAGKTVATLGEPENIPVAYPYYAQSPWENDSGTSLKQNVPEGSVRAGEATSSTVLLFGPAVQPESPAVQNPSTNPVPAPMAQQLAPKTDDSALNNTYRSFFQRLANILSPKDTRTPEQKALFEYGNTAGTIIKTFEDTHRNTFATLKAFFDSHTAASIAAGNAKSSEAYVQLNANTAPQRGTLTSAQLAANVQTVSDEYVKLSSEIRAINNVPPYAESANEKLAGGYDAVAKGISGLTHANTDKELLAAIDAYNATADSFIKTYVSLVDLFSAYGVTFSANDPGAIFSFSAAGGL